jgi:hypothetical protein
VLPRRSPTSGECHSPETAKNFHLIAIVRFGPKLQFHHSKKRFAAIHPLGPSRQPLDGRYRITSTVGKNRS